MDEITYLNTTSATVTSSRIVIGAHTFATRNVGSVVVQTVDKPGWPIYIGLIGAAMLIGSVTSGFGVSGVMGFVMLAAAAGVLFSPQKLKLKLVAGGGEVVALETTDRIAINALHQAIVQAISVR